MALRLCAVRSSDCLVETLYVFEQSVVTALVFSFDGYMIGVSKEVKAASRAEVCLLNVRPWYPNIDDKVLEDKEDTYPYSQPTGEEEAEERNKLIAEHPSQPHLSTGAKSPNKLETASIATLATVRMSNDVRSSKETDDVKDAALCEDGMLKERETQALPYAAEVVENQMYVRSISLEPIYGELVAISGDLYAADTADAKIYEPEPSETAQHGQDQNRDVEHDGALCIYHLRPKSSIVSTLANKQKPRQLKLLQKITHTKPINCAAFSPDGRLLAASGAMRMPTRKADGEQSTSKSSQHKKLMDVWVYEVVWTKTKEGQIRYEEGKVISTPPVYRLSHPSDVLCMAFSPMWTQKMAATGEEDTRLLALSNTSTHMPKEKMQFERRRGTSRRINIWPRVPQLLLATSCYQDAKEVKAKKEELEAVKEGYVTELQQRDDLKLTSQNNDAFKEKIRTLEKQIQDKQELLISLLTGGSRDGPKTTSQQKNAQDLKKEVKDLQTQLEHEVEQFSVVPEDDAKDDDATQAAADGAGGNKNKEDKAALDGRIIGRKEKGPETEKKVGYATSSIGDTQAGGRPQSAAPPGIDYGQMKDAELKEKINELIKHIAEVDETILGFRNAGGDDAEDGGHTQSANFASRVTIFQLEQMEHEEGKSFKESKHAESRKPRSEIVREFRATRATDAIDVLSFSVCGRILAIGGRDKLVRLYHVATGQPMRCIKHEHPVVGMAFSHPYGQHGQLIMTLTGSNDWKPSMDGKQVAGRKQAASVGSSNASTPSDLKVIRLYSSKATSFWSKKPRPRPQHLVRYLPTEHLIFDQTRSMRSLLCIAASEYEQTWLLRLFLEAEKGSQPVLGSILLQRDASGRHALDYALESNKPKIIALFLRALWQPDTPPRARMPLTELRLLKNDDLDSQEDDFDEDEDDGLASNTDGLLNSLLSSLLSSLMQFVNSKTEDIKKYLQTITNDPEFMDDLMGSKKKEVLQTTHTNTNLCYTHLAARMRMRICTCACPHVTPLDPHPPHFWTGP